MLILPFEVVEIFRAFLASYPAMRLGQAVCNVAEWDDFHADNVSDEQLATQAWEHLERRFGDVRLDSAAPPEDWAVALNELRRLEHDMPFGELLSGVAKRVGKRLYDVENEELADAARNAILDRVKFDKPIPA